MQIGPSHISVQDLQRRIAMYDDENAYKQLNFLLFNSLTRFSTGILNSKEVAEEIVSDVFIRVWTDRSKLHLIEDLKLYLFVAVKNNSLRKLKQLNKKSTISLDEFPIEINSSYPDPENQMLSAEAFIQIEQAINLLPNRAKLIFKLAKEDGLPYKAIAELLHISVKTVDHQLAIALKKITIALTDLAMINRKKKV